MFVQGTSVADVPILGVLPLFWRRRAAVHRVGDDTLFTDTVLDGTLEFRTMTIRASPSTPVLDDLFLHFLSTGGLS